jgi:hypothetical protein
MLRRIPRTPILPVAGIVWVESAKSGFVLELSSMLLDLRHAVLQVRELGDGHLVRQDRPPRPELNRLGLDLFGERDEPIGRLHGDAGQAADGLRRRVASTSPRTLGSLAQQNAVLRATSFFLAHAAIDRPRAIARARWIF